MATSRQGDLQQQSSQVLDPKFEWLDNATTCVIRLNLQGFKKEDFRVQVDGTGRLTVRGQLPAGAADGKHVRFDKVFQLPATANLDDITGRFDANVLTLTVPKRPPVVTTTTPKPKPKEEEEEDTNKPPKKEDAAKRRKQEQEAAAAKTRKQQEQDQKPTPAAVRRDEAKPPTSETAPAAAPTEKPEAKQEAASEKAKTVVDRESLAEKVKLRAREERAKAASAAAEGAEREKKKACGGWKERLTGELEELADMKWADGLVEMARNNKEVVAAAVAAFSLGFFVSQKLSSRK